MKLPFAPKELIEYYDLYIEERGITDKEEKRRLWWAMFYCAREEGEWIETLGKSE